MMRKLIKTLLLLLLSSTSFAQGDLGTIRGVITNKSNEKIVGATVFVTNKSTGFKTGTITDLEGNYVIKRLPLGGPYSVKISYTGYGEQEIINLYLNQGDVIQKNIILTGQIFSVGEVFVTASRVSKNHIESLGASTSVLTKDMVTMPMNGRNFTSLIDLSPFSKRSNLAGQLGTSTSYTIDGMTARNPTAGGASNRGPYAVSTEAIREFKVVTNDYDVTMGRSGGGSISSVTKSGTNNFQGSVFLYQRSDILSSPYDVNGNKTDKEYSTSQYGFSLGGPIVKDKAHFYFTFEQQRDKRPLIIADINNESDAKRYGISKDNLNHFIDVARNKYGVSSTHPQVGTFTKKRPSTTIFGRIDWQINKNNLLTLRNNFNYDNSKLGVRDNTTRINLYEVYGNAINQDNSFMASLRTVIDEHKTNELKFQYLYTRYDGETGELLPSQNIPRAIVQNISSNIGGKNYNLNSIQIGGQRYSPEFFKNDVLQVVNNLYWNTEKVEYTFGIDVMFSHLNSLATSEMNGRYYYSSMSDFENNTPYRYAREVPIGNPNVKQKVIDAALYAQAKMNLFKGADLSFGIRGDYTYYFDKPNYNPLLKKELGLSTSHSVKDFQIQPRLQFTWDINEKKTDIIKLGAGVFGSNMNNYAMINNLQFDGQRIVSIDIVGSNVPQADFLSYRKNPSTAPGAELFDKLGIEKVATFNINSKNLKIPTVYKFNISYNKFFNEKLRAGIGFYATLARNNYMYIDKNMVEKPFFYLKNENNRGVYVPANTISTKGNTDWTKGKISNKIGRVLELVSEGKINTFSMVLDASYRYYKDGEISISYTWNDSKDNTSYNGNVANSATRYNMINDDPRDLSKMNYSDNQFRHKLVVYGTTPSFMGINVGFRYSAIAGTRYSMVVGGSINGDFVNGNDLAYVFNPNDSKTSESIRNGINDLLKNPDISSSFKDYMKDSFGQIAKRNGGINPLSGVLDIKISKDFKIFKNNKIQASIDIFNVGNLLNKEWGLSKEHGKQFLHSVNGFDQSKQEYVYSVNPNAGKVRYSGNPWQIQIGIKYSF